MEEYERIMAALRKAHAAGNKEHAARLAGMAKAAKAKAQSPESTAMTEGRAKLSGMTQSPQVQPAPRSTGQAVYDNLIGDPNDGVDSTGEKIGRGINDVAKATGAGLARGTAGLVGLPGTIGDAMDAGMTWAGQKAGVIPDDWQAPQNALSSGSMVEAMSNATGGATDYRGEGLPAKFAGTVAEFVPGAAAFGAKTVGNMLRFAVAPGVASEAAGQLTEGSPYEGLARVGGALAGGIVPGLMAKGAAKLISPNGGADPERLKLAQVLDDFGVPLSAGQRVGNEALRRKEGLTAAGQDLNATQREAFTKAALATAGEDAARATPEVLKRMSDRIGSVFDDVTRGVDVTPDPQSVTALSAANDLYKSLAPTGNQAPLVGNIFKDVTKAMRGGNAIPAATVNTWRSSLSKLTASADAATREAAQAALETVDDMLTASLTAAGRAEDVARLATARSEWRNYLAIQKAATASGDSAAAGLLSPASLRNAVVQQGRSAYAKGGRGDIGELARAGVGTMDSLPNSGTPAGLRAMIPAGSLPGAIGATIGSQFGPLGTAGGAVLGAALPGVTGAIRMSRPIQNYLANQAINPASARVGTGAATALIPFAAERNALAPR